MSGASLSRAVSQHFFLHIPKCGGTTFSDYLSRNFARSEIYTTEDMSAVSEKKSLFSPIEEKDEPQVVHRLVEVMKTANLVVGSHFKWRIILQMIAAKRRLFVYLLLRDPRTRIVSHYHHIQKIPLAHTSGLNSGELQVYRLVRELSFEKFCRQMTTEPHCWTHFFNLQTQYLSSYRLTPENWKTLGKQAILEDALHNLSQIDYVADVKDLNEFARLISLDNHWLPPGRLGALNAGEHSSQTTADQVAQVPDSLVALDQVLYEEGLKKYAAWRDQVLHDATVTLWKNSRHFDQGVFACDQWKLHFEDELFGDNFHGREGTGKETFRWMGPERQSRLYVPVRPGFPHWISVYLLSFISPDMFSKTTYFINGREATPQCSNAEGCTVVTFSVDPADTNTGVVELSIRADHTTSEYALNLSSDKREKSIAVKCVKLSLKPPA